MRSAMRGLLAGAYLAALEITWVLLAERTLFLSGRELSRYALLSVLTLPAVGALLGLLLAGASRALISAERPTGSGREPSAVFAPLRMTVFAIGMPLCGAIAYALTDGRRVRDVPFRLVIVGVVAALAAAGLALWAESIARRQRRARPALATAIGFAALAALALVLDAAVLRRLYPAFHLALGGLSWLAALSAAALAWPTPRRERVVPSPTFVRRATGTALASCVLGGALVMQQVAAAPGLRFPIEQGAPLTAKLLEHWPAPRASSDAQLVAGAGVGLASVTADGGTALKSVDLRDRDVLLITIDALRADRLAAYGGKGLTPQLDALAAQGRVFLRAYTPTPHTSYALTSMLTGKPLGLLHALTTLRDEPVTLPQVLRRNGMRTAAFYPPAIFHVDGERFAALAEQNFGFEYVKEMFASGRERVEQLRAYLAQSEPGYPLFVWVHLFEPHEPYTPEAAFAPTDPSASPESLYDGEVRAADHATGELVRLFRAARPDATVIVSADHGEEHGDHGGRYHGTTLFDEQARVPLLVSAPGRIAPGVSRAPVELTDLTPTLLAALGIPRDARMQGDDLGPVLADASAAGPPYAFASLPGLSMVTDGRLKLLCTHRSGSCQLFDLERDPAERADQSAVQAAQVERMRAAWHRYVAELPRIEAIDLSGQAFPAALARARLGDASVTPELVTLLGSPRTEVRAEAASALGELGALHARPVLSRLHMSEADPEVAVEFAIAALRLGESSAGPRVLAAIAPELELAGHDELPSSAPSARASKAALALADAGYAEVAPLLLWTAVSSAVAEPMRRAAIDALAECRPLDRRTLLGLTELLADVRLRVDVAATLQALGDGRAIPALRKALAEEVYPDARRAAVEALTVLGDRATALRLAKRSEAFAAQRALEQAAAEAAPDAGTSDDNAPAEDSFTP